jgi:hypothetical protein
MLKDVRMFVYICVSICRHKGSGGAVSDNNQGMMAVGLLMTILSKTTRNKYFE